MNVQLKIEDASWTSFINTLRNALQSSDTYLKKAFQVIWPKEAASHFEQEMGPDGHWEPWKESTRAGRIAHEKKHTSARQRAFARTAFIREGGLLLQVTGRLRTETVQEPEMVESMTGLKVLSPTPYSGFLDEGTDKMVARPFMWLGEDAQVLFADTLEEMIFGGSAD